VCTANRKHSDEGATVHAQPLSEIINRQGTTSYELPDVTELTHRPQNYQQLGQPPKTGKNYQEMVQPPQTAEYREYDTIDDSYLKVIG